VDAGGQAGSTTLIEGFTTKSTKDTKAAEGGEAHSVALRATGWL